MKEVAPKTMQSVNTIAAAIRAYQSESKKSRLNFT